MQSLFIFLSFFVIYLMVLVVYYRRLNKKQASASAENAALHTRHIKALAKVAANEIVVICNEVEALKYTIEQKSLTVQHFEGRVNMYRDLSDMWLQKCEGLKNIVEERDASIVELQARIDTLVKLADGQKAAGDAFSACNRVTNDSGTIPRAAMYLGECLSFGDLSKYNEMYTCGDTIKVNSIMYLYNGYTWEYLSNRG